MRQIVGNPITRKLGAIQGPPPWGGNLEALDDAGASRPSHARSIAAISINRKRDNAPPSFPNGGRCFALLAPRSLRPSGHLRCASSTPPGVSVVGAQTSGAPPAAKVGRHRGHPSSSFSKGAAAPTARSASPSFPNGRVGSPQRTQTSGAKRRLPDGHRSFRVRHIVSQARPSRKSRTARRSIPTISLR